jgi:hypothetical protein
MSKSTWDSLSESERRSCVDAGRFHPDGTTKVGGRTVEDLEQAERDEQAAEDQRRPADGPA